ncbi:uncharacterized protein LOC131039381 [Cryptomeria japonica]|uniref:uncharacterized protein LOC131039381 n=1 Tax=Cryptomeria japonica TaxID=3369 RepID=UPI0027DAB00A|nr:uncharacterized protein LOC131039381 [Cryptomeria japonica]
MEDTTSDHNLSSKKRKQNENTSQIACDQSNPPDNATNSNNNQEHKRSKLESPPASSIIEICTTQSAIAFEECIKAPCHFQEDFASLHTTPQGSQMKN